MDDELWVPLLNPFDYSCRIKCHVDLHLNNSPVLLIDWLTDWCFLRDQTKPGHILGDPELRNNPDALDTKNMSLTPFTLVRMVTHLAMLLGASEKSHVSGWSSTLKIRYLYLHQHLLFRSSFSTVDFIGLQALMFFLELTLNLRYQMILSR